MNITYSVLYLFRKDSIRFNKKLMYLSANNFKTIIEKHFAHVLIKNDGSLCVTMFDMSQLMMNWLVMNIVMHI